MKMLKLIALFCCLLATGCSNPCAHVQEESVEIPGKKDGHEGAVQNPDCIQFQISL